MTASEQRFVEFMLKAGYRVLRNGWPDFLVIDPKQTRAFAVEQKRGADRLRPEQIEMHAVLKQLGVPVYVVREDFAAVLRRRGRAFVHAAPLEDLNRRATQLEAQITTIAQEHAKLCAILKDSGVALEDSPVFAPGANVVALVRAAQDDEPGAA